jgi:hypothetical protein
MKAILIPLCAYSGSTRGQPPCLRSVVRLAVRNGGGMVSVLLGFAHNGINAHHHHHFFVSWRRCGLMFRVRKNGRAQRLRNE